MLLLSILVTSGEDGNESIEHITGTDAMEGAHRDRVAQVQSIKLNSIELTLKAIGLIHRQHDSSGHWAQDLCDLGISARQPFAPINHEDNCVGLVDSQTGLAKGTALQFALGQTLLIGTEEQTSSVDHSKVVAVPETLAIEPITGGTGEIFDDGTPLTDQPVEEG